MPEQPKSEEPRMEWVNGEVRVSLPFQGRMIDAKWRPGVTTVVRIREKGAEIWSLGFETPLNGCNFVGLQPGTEYEIQITYKNAVGEGPPTRLTHKTRASDDVGNVVPFPKK